MSSTEHSILPGIMNPSCVSHFQQFHSSTSSTNISHRPVKQENQHVNLPTVSSVTCPTAEGSSSKSSFRAAHPENLVKLDELRSDSLPSHLVSQSISTKNTIDNHITMSRLQNLHLPSTSLVTSANIA